MKAFSDWLAVATIVGLIMLACCTVAVWREDRCQRAGGTVHYIGGSAAPCVGSDGRLIDP